MASSITFGSYVGAVASAGFSNSPIVYGASAATGTAVVAAPYSYATVLPGTQFVSYTSATNVPAGITKYFTTVNGGVAGEGGSISVAADDSVQVFLNGILIGNTAPAVYDSVRTYGLPWPRTTCLSST